MIVGCRMTFGRGGRWDGFEYLGQHVGVYRYCSYFASFIITLNV